MRFVLKDSDGDYFMRMDEDRCLCPVTLYTKDVDLAMIFTAEFKDGRLICQGDLPTKGDWQPVAVGFREL